MGKRGRPRKEVKEEDDGNQVANLTNPAQGGTKTHAKAVLGPCATVSTCSRYQLRSVGKISSHSSKSTPPMKIDLSVIDVSEVFNSPPDSCMYPSQHEKMTSIHSGSSRLTKRGKTIDSLKKNSMSYSTNEELCLEKSISEILPQTYGDEELQPAAALSESLEVVSKNHLLKKNTNMGSNIVEKRLDVHSNNSNQEDKHLSQSQSLNLTEMAQMLSDDSCDVNEDAVLLETGMVYVNGYKVKSEWGPLLKTIFLKHGDIAKNSSLQSSSFRSFFLEIVCGILQKLRDTEFMHITSVDLKSMFEQVRDLESVNLQVGWLHQRLDDISEAMRLCRGYSALKVAQTRNIQAFEKKEKELQSYNAEMLTLEKKICLVENDLAALTTEAEKINESVSSTKAKVKCYYRRSLVNGLL